MGEGLAEKESLYSVLLTFVIKLLPIKIAHSFDYRKSNKNIIQHRRQQLIPNTEKNINTVTESTDFEAIIMITISFFAHIPT